MQRPALQQFCCLMPRYRCQQDTNRCVRRKARLDPVHKASLPRINANCRRAGLYALIVLCKVAQANTPFMQGILDKQHHTWICTCSLATAAVARCDTGQFFVTSPSFHSCKAAPDTTRKCTDQYRCRRSRSKSGDARETLRDIRGAGSRARLRVRDRGDDTESPRQYALC
jgi:hypothetical protein